MSGVGIQRGDGPASAIELEPLPLPGCGVSGGVLAIPVAASIRPSYTRDPQAQQVNIGEG